MTHDPAPSPLRFDAGGEQPLLIVSIDAEAEFDWAAPHRRGRIGTRSIEAQGPAQAILERFGCRPIYLVDYPVASDAASAALLRTLAREGRCEIGAHLNPWLTPPFAALDETELNAGNLDRATETAKLARLTETIGDAIGVRPRAYRAGRYAIGPNSFEILHELGFDADLSVVPYTSFHAQGGPDFTGWDWRPSRVGPGRELLEIPLTCGLVGALATFGQGVNRVLARSPAKRLRLRGLAARTGLFERIRLTPEGVSLTALTRLTRGLLRQGCRLFCLGYHSPSLLPGNTPYAPDEAACDALLARLEAYLRFFRDEIGGGFTTPAEVVARFRDAAQDAGGVGRAGYGGRPAARRVS